MRNIKDAKYNIEINANSDQHVFYHVYIINIRQIDGFSLYIIFSLHNPKPCKKIIERNKKRRFCGRGNIVKVRYHRIILNNKHF